MHQGGVSQGDKHPQRHRGKTTFFRNDKQVAVTRALSAGEDGTGCGSSVLQVQLPLISDSVTAAQEAEVIFSESPCKWQRLNVSSGHIPLVLCEVPSSTGASVTSGPKSGSHGGRCQSSPALSPPQSRQPIREESWVG